MLFDCCLLLFDAKKPFDPKIAEQGTCTHVFGNTLDVGGALDAGVALRITVEYTDFCWAQAIDKKRRVGGDHQLGLVGSSTALFGQFGQ